MLRTRIAAPACALLLACFAVSIVRHARAESTTRVFELRTYTTADGRLDALKTRFRDHTIAIFNRHGMTSIGYFTPQDAPASANTLVYILAHPSREEAKKHWAEFNADPEWQKVKAASEASGPIVTHVDSVFLDPTDFSHLR